MSQVTTDMIKELRERTGAGMADCKKALVESEGSMDKAIEYLRVKGLAKAAKKAGRVATEGLISQYIHGNGRIGVLLETNCETDFVARNPDFVTFTKEVAMQIAAMNPQYVSAEDVPADMIEKERSIRREAAAGSGKPANVVDKMVEGQISKWLKEICLLDQPWVKDDKKTIHQLTQELVAKLGEGLDKKTDNFAEEVARQAGLQ
jgi:elongation factor Ts